MPINKYAGLPFEERSAYQRMRLGLRKNQGTVMMALGVNYKTIMGREAQDRVKPGSEAWLVMEWCAKRGRLPSDAEQDRAESLRDAPMYRAARIASGLSQVEAAAALGVTGQTISNRETGRGRYLITREQAFALMIVVDEAEARRAATMAALAGMVEKPPKIARNETWTRRRSGPHGQTAGDWQGILARMTPAQRAKYDDAGRLLPGTKWRPDGKDAEQIERELALLPEAVAAERRKYWKL